ncbi:MAG: hypothetical protein MJZ67_00875 [Bacteroidales bacterium]|nr:hypothetical protein [Bacteroidales bacterium]
MEQRIKWLLGGVESAMLVATWMVAVALCCQTELIGKAMGWGFLACKGVELLLSIVGWIRCPALTKKLIKGRYILDIQHPNHGLTQALLRHSWELPQTMIGYSVAMCRTITYQVDRVEYLDGNTFAIDDGRGDYRNMGCSMGCMINIWLTDNMMMNFEYEAKFGFGQLLMHEFGHTFDSLWLGPLYIMAVGLPSLASVTLEHFTHGRYQHHQLYAERWANKHAQRYFCIPIRDLEEQG